MDNVEIRITDAIAHFGRKGDGYGGKAQLARALGITQSAIARWAGPHLPKRHTKTLLAKPHRLRALARKRNDGNGGR